MTLTCSVCAPTQQRNAMGWAENLPRCLRFLQTLPPGEHGRREWWRRPWPADRKTWSPRYETASYILCNTETHQVNLASQYHHSCKIWFQYHLFCHAAMAHIWNKNTPNSNPLTLTILQWDLQFGRRRGWLEQFHAMAKKFISPGSQREVTQVLTKTVSCAKLEHLKTMCTI